MPWQHQQRRDQGTSKHVGLYTCDTITDQFAALLNTDTRQSKSFCVCLHRSTDTLRNDLGLFIHQFVLPINPHWLQHPCCLVYQPALLMQNHLSREPPSLAETCNRSNTFEQMDKLC